MRNPDFMQQALQAYIQHKTGPFVGAPTTTGFASLSKIQPDFTSAESHIQSLIAAHRQENPASDPAGRDALLARQLLDPKEAVCQIVGLPTGANLANAATPSKIFPSEEDGMWMTLGVGSTRSLSRGSVHIHSADPRTYPTIDPSYFSHPLDVDMIARAILHVLSFTEIEPLKSALRRDASGKLVVAKCHSSLPETLDQAKEFVRANTVTEYHPVGTCAMLSREKGGVVDEELRVHGTRNLRVCDASIFPLHVQGNIVSLVYAVAEKGADLIRGKVSVNGTNGVNGH
jgi:choline dehydrogenase